MSLTDSRRMWKLANERGSEGVHSHDARRLGITGNPSQRAKDIADHVPFWTIREARNGRPGSRYFTDGNQPGDAVAVRPNRSENGQETNEKLTEIVPVSEEKATTEPVAILRDWSGEWRELPVSELEAERRAA